tara:strand:+ start:510 stop:740 length:231 start_codon:yes stop_codon:yes gene_type:complete
MRNPKQTELLNAFLHYLEEHKYMVIRQDFFKESKSWYNTTPKRGDKVVLNINYKMERPSDEELNHEIEMFLKKQDD